MKKSDLTYIVGCAFSAAVAIFYSCIIFFKITVPRYYPTLHEWRWDNVKGVPSQGWYGIQGFAFIGGIVVAIAVYIACKRAGTKEMELKPGTVKGAALATLGVVLASMAYILFHEFHRWGTI
ncbi:MAG: hypothetical protein ACYSWO_15675 [Planctomycetota bacterium]|jgi:ABC-type Fe3+-siderophore transport system permease subunit